MSVAWPNAADGTGVRLRVAAAAHRCAFRASSQLRSPKIPSSVSPQPGNVRGQSLDFRKAFASPTGYWQALGHKLLRRAGRGLALTEVGQTVYRYADEIFPLGQELLDALRGQPTGRPMRFAFGVADVVPKLIAHRILAPVLELPEPIALTVTEHYKKGFPGSLDGAPLLMPTDDSSLRRNLDAWFERKGLRPRLAGEFEDSALLKVFGRSGAGLFAAPSVIEADVVRQFEVQCVGRIEEVREQFFAISVERRIRHPAVVAVTEAARNVLFGEGAS